MSANKQQPHEGVAMSEGAQAPNAPKKGKAVMRTGAESVPLYYANFAEVSMSIFDLRIVFGVVRANTENELAIQEVASVNMSPQHAKSLHRLLSKRIENYEKRFGPIPTGPLATEGEAEESTAAI